MKLPIPLSWLLGGALAASLVWNFHLAGAVAALECRLPASPAAPQPQPQPVQAKAPAAVSCCLPPDVVAGLELDERQRAAIAECCLSCTSEQAPMARAADELRDELRRVLQEDPDDLPRLMELAQELGRQRCAELVRMVRSIAEVQRTLTPDQRLALKEGRL